MLTPRQYRELLVRIKRCRVNVYDHMRRHYHKGTEAWRNELLRDAVGHQIACLRRHNRAIREG